MSTHYLIDGHTTPVESSLINDVRISMDGRSVANGNFVVPVPGHVKLAEKPLNLQNLLDQKFLGILASYPGYTQIIYEDLLSTSDLVPVPGSSSLKLGMRGIAALAEGSIVTTPTALGSNVSVLIACVESHRWYYTNPKSGRMERIFEEALDAFSLEVSTNGGSDFSPASNGSLTKIPLGLEGSSLQLRITANNSPTEKEAHLTSWAVIY